MTDQNRKKIVSLDELQSISQSERERGKKIVLCHGVFDLVHPGHIFHFKEAKKNGDLLFVTITPDEYVLKGPGRPYFNQKLRLESLAALTIVDYVALNQWPTSIETIKKLKPHTYAKGQDYKNHEKDVTRNIIHEKAAVEKVGGKIIYTDEEMFSSSEIINSFFKSRTPETEAYLSEFKKEYSADHIIEQLQNLRDIKITIIGEAILDQYHYCQPLAKTPKDSIVATKYLSEENFAGGTLAIANHLANFCKEITLVTVVGQEEEYLSYFHSKLKQNVIFRPIIAEDRSTIIKRRFLDANFYQKMFEVQFLNDCHLKDKEEKEVIKIFNEKINSQDMVVIGDFGHGMITPRIKESFYNCGKFLALCTQSNSANMGFNPITSYRRAHYASIDEPELRFAAHSKYGKLSDLVDIVRGRIEVDSFMVSLGPKGNIIFSNDGKSFETPIFSNRIVDRTGAGDALFSVTSPCVYKGYPHKLIGFVANCVGALAVETVCNREPIEPTPLYKFITYLLK